MWDQTFTHSHDSVCETLGDVKQSHWEYNMDAKGCTIFICVEMFIDHHG